MRTMTMTLGLALSVSVGLGASCAGTRPVAAVASQPRQPASTNQSVAASQTAPIDHSVAASQTAPTSQLVAPSPSALSGPATEGNRATPQPPPAPLGDAQLASLQVGDLTRSYLLHLPAKLPTAAPILLVLHGSGGSGRQMRESTAYRFDKLADEQGLIAVYPDGFERHWNDCRKIAHYSARTRNIDDLGFLRALIAHLKKTYGADARRVYTVGYSNGGHMAFRLALEAPELTTGIAAIAASLPAPENMDCHASGRAVPVLMLNGTEDPINPYQGGDVTIFGHGNRGRVLSAADSAAWFAQLDGATPAITAEHLPSSAPTDPGWAERSLWKSPSGMEVGLFTIHGGGHTLPQAQIRYPAQLGNTFTGLDGPREIWRFFARQPLRAATP